MAVRGRRDRVERLRAGQATGRLEQRELEARGAAQVEGEGRVGGRESWGKAGVGYEKPSLKKGIKWEGRGEQDKGPTGKAQPLRERLNQAGVYTRKQDWEGRALEGLRIQMGKKS